jgi:hypothetical protein
MGKQAKNEGGGPRKHRGLKAVLWSLLGLWALLILILQIALNSTFLTKVVNHFAERYIDGEVTFSGIKASMFKSFPNLNVSLDDFTLTYPHERFASYDSLIPPGDSLHYKGWGPAAGSGNGIQPGQVQMDTLASFRRMSLSVNYMEALKKKLRIPHAILEHPRIFIHRYDSLQANWNVVRVARTADKDTSSFVLPPLSVGKISLEDAPFTVYTSLPDSLAGSVALNHLSLKNHREQHYDIDLDSRILLKTQGTGTMDLPLTVKTKFYPDFEKNIYSVKDLKASVAMIDLTADGTVDLSGDNPYIKAEAAIDKEHVSEITGYFGKNFPILKKLDTDATLSLNASCDGWYIRETKSLPQMSVHLEVPDSRIRWEGIDEEARFDLEADATVVDGKLVAQVPDLCFHVNGADITLKGSAEDLLNGDPLFNIDSKVHARLDSLARYLPQEMGITASGNLDGKVKGSFKVSQLDLYDFGDIGLQGRLVSDGIRIRDPKDSLTAYLGSTTIDLGPYSHEENDGDEHGEEHHHHVGIQATIDSLFAEYGSSTYIRGRGVKLSAHNSEETIKGYPGKHPLHGHLDITSIGMMDIDSCFVGVRGSSNVFKFWQIPKGKAKVPYLSLSSSNRSVAIRETVNRYTASGVSLNVSAHPNEVKAKEKSNLLLDSLARVYPGVPRDSLLYRAIIDRNGGKLPDYLTEKDFRKKDINIRLGESVSNYINDWDLAGSFRIKEGKVITPYFPLENNLSGLNGKFTNNRIDLNSLTLKSGVSDISAAGSLVGIKRALTSGRGRMNLNMNLSSGLIDLNELLLAMNAGKQFVPPGEKTALSGVDDRTYLDAVKGEAVVDTSAISSLIVIPSNLNAKINIQAQTIRYSDLESSFMSTDLEMRERCLQVTNTLAMTNMGEVFAEGFYSTRTKKDLKAGFDLMLSNITAEKVIRLFPAVDSIIPMLKAFKGLLDCEIAATSSIDTSMNIILPSLNGMIKIDGKNLSLSESRDLDKLRRTLRFKDRDSSYIDAMSVRGIVKEDQLEVFPFILKVDRYTVALDGVQRFDQNFKYHVSALKSPIPFRFGVNLGGRFDNWKWRLGKAKFKSTKVPLFDEEIDGVRLNLVNAIHNIFTRGVEQAMLQNEKAQEAVEEKKTEIAYSSEETEDLSAEEQQELESLENAAVEEESPSGSE